MSTKQNATLTMVVSGLDKEGKPRAAAYPADMTETATKAAADWELMLGKVESEEALKLAKDLPHGSLFPSHKVQPPIIKRESYNALLKAISFKAGQGKTAKNDASTPAKFINSWNAVVAGSIVLHEQKRGEGYFPCKVTAVSSDLQTLTLVWVGYDDLPAQRVRSSLLRRRLVVARLHSRLLPQLELRQTYLALVPLLSRPR